MTFWADFIEGFKAEGLLTEADFEDCSFDDFADCCFDAPPFMYEKLTPFDLRLPLALTLIGLRLPLALTFDLLILKAFPAFPMLLKMFMLLLEPTDRIELRELRDFVDIFGL